MRSVRLAALICWTAATSLLAPSSVPAQESAPEPFLLLEVSRECATPAEDTALADEIKLRMPGAFVVRGALEGVAPDWRVTWRPSGDRKCELLFSSAESNSAMDLGPAASIPEIQLAASRVAWLASVSRPRDVATTAPLDPPVEPPVEEPPVEEPPVEEPPVEEPPVEEPPAEAEEPPAEPEKPAAPESETPAYDAIGTKVSVVPGLTIVPTDVPERDVPTLSLNVLAGSSYGLEGVELGFVFNHERAFARGTQLAMGANIVGGDADVVQVAVGANGVGGELYGVQASAGANWAGRAHGVQAAAGVNIAGDDSRVLQLASGLNVAGSMWGLQIAPVNFAHGVIDGGQIGVVNIAESSDYSLGIVNVLYGEPLYLTAMVNSTGGLMFGLQHGGTYLRYAYLAEVNPIRETPFWKAGVGLGGHVPAGKLYADLDFLVFWAVPFGEPVYKVSLNPQLKASVGIQIAKRFAVFGGAAANALWTGIPDGPGMAGQPNREIALTGTVARLFAWPDFHLGVRF